MVTRALLAVALCVLGACTPSQVSAQAIVPTEIIIIPTVTPLPPTEIPTPLPDPTSAPVPSPTPQIEAPSPTPRPTLPVINIPIPTPPLPEENNSANSASPITVQIAVPTFVLPTLVINIPTATPRPAQRVEGYVCLASKPSLVCPDDATFIEGVLVSYRNARGEQKQVRTDAKGYYRIEDSFDSDSNLSVFIAEFIPAFPSQPPAPRVDFVLTVPVLPAAPQEGDRIVVQFTSILLLLAVAIGFIVLALIGSLTLQSVWQMKRTLASLYGVAYRQAYLVGAESDKSIAMSRLVSMCQAYEIPLESSAETTAIRLLPESPSVRFTSIRHTLLFASDKDIQSEIKNLGYTGKPVLYRFSQSDSEIINVLLSSIVGAESPFRVERWAVAVL